MWLLIYLGFESQRPCTYIDYTFKHVFNVATDGLDTCQLLAVGKPHIHPQFVFANQSQFKTEMSKWSHQSSTGASDCHCATLDLHSDYKIERIVLVYIIK